ncbi:MAG TPA: OmpA family protein [Bacteroidales bacterium]|nr:OmpA family protein [Bacteroidales bacterium]
MRKQISGIFFFLLLVTLEAFPQAAGEALQEVFNDAEYFFMQEFYADALPEYMKVYKRGFADNASINYRIGICYLNIPGQKKEAIPYLQKASQNLTPSYKEGNIKENRAPYDVFLYLGNAYRIDNQLDNAIKAYEKYLELMKNVSNEMTQFALQEINACKNATEMQKHPVPVSKVNLGKPVNSAEANYKPVVSQDESVLIYVNRLKFYDAIYMSRKINGKWSAPENITEQLQSDGDQYPCFLTPDGTQLFLTKEDQFNSDIYTSAFSKNQWNKSRPVGKTINSKFWESHASVTADGNHIYFASNRNGGLGGMDIYRSDKLPNGDWGPPVNLGPVINTSLNEDCPFITPDGKKLFFSSQGHSTMGGFDIFCSSLKEDGTWDEPQNLGYPLNTTDDDLFFYPVQDGKAGYMALYEEGGLGDDDIYRIEFVPETKEEKVPQIVPAETEKAVVPPLDTTQKPEKPPVVPPPALPEKITVHPILFGFNQALLTAEARNVLDLLVRALQLNNDLRVEIIGHTDAIGSDEYNMNLGKKRAEMVKLYLTNRHIAPSRITTSSMGERNPVAINKNPDGSDNPEGRKYNRRADFKIIAGDNGLLIIEPLQIPASLKK